MIQPRTNGRRLGPVSFARFAGDAASSLSNCCSSAHMLVLSAALAQPSHARPLYGKNLGIDYRPTYPDSCPLGADLSSGTPVPTRLCLPRWEPSYNMSLSTIIMPCNRTGYYDPTVASRYGVVDIDWSNAKQVWANQQPMDCEERLQEQARIIKRLNPQTKVWVYRNLVKALPWYTSVREKLCDPAYKGWFLKFKATEPHVPRCDTNYDPPKCTAFYHDQEQTPQHPKGDAHHGSCVQQPCDCGCVPCGEYLWNHRNQSLREWLVDVHVTGASSVGGPDVDGIFTDDEWRTDVEPAHGGGPSEEDSHAVSDTGLSRAEVAEMIGNWTLSMKAAQQATLDKGGFAWRLLVPGSSTGGGDPLGPLPQARAPEQCAARMRLYCGPGACVAAVSNPAPGLADSPTRPADAASRRPRSNNTLHHSAMMMNAGEGDDFLPSLAAFLLLRGPYAWLGTAWQGCDTVPPRPAALDVDYGVPTDAQCRETAPGTSAVFVREWSKASVRLDCNKWEGAITPRVRGFQ